MNHTQERTSRRNAASVVLLFLTAFCFSGCRSAPQFFKQNNAPTWSEANESLATIETLTASETVVDSNSSTNQSANGSIGFAETIKPDVERPFNVESVLEEQVIEFQTPPILETMFSDQVHFYSRENLKPFLLTLGGSAILANTKMDQEFADWYQNDVRSSSSDEVAEFAKVFGEQWPMMGAYVTASIGGRLLPQETPLALWGDRSMRSMFVGVPPLLFLQKALGSSRPNESPIASNWDFWADENGASGHAFVGAVPFLVAAQLAENPRHKATWMALSTLPGWSRINDDNHYLSQVIMGWWLAYTATQSVERSDESLNYQIAPMVIENAMGFEMTWRR